MPLTERVIALDRKGGMFGGLKGRVGVCCGLAGGFDAAGRGVGGDGGDMGSDLSYLAVPDLLDELNDVCSLIAVDGLRGKDGQLLDRGRRRSKMVGYKEGREEWCVDKDLVFEAGAVLVVLRSAVRLRGGKEAVDEARVSLVALVGRLWPIAMGLEGKGGLVEERFGESLLSLLLGVVLNFVSGNLAGKKMLDVGSRGVESLSGKVVGLVLKGGRVGGGVGGVGELGMKIMQSLALPPSPARGSLNVSGVYPMVFKMIGGCLRGREVGTNGVGCRKGGWGEGAEARVEAGLGLLVNATLDEEGRRAVFMDWGVFERCVDDLVEVEEYLGTGAKRMVYLLLRNVCLGKGKSRVYGKDGWLNFVLRGGSVEEVSVRGAALLCLWVMLFKSEKAVGVVRMEENLALVICSERLYLEGLRRRGGGIGGGEEGEEEVSVAMKAIMSLMRVKEVDEEGRGAGLAGGVVESI